MDVPMTDQPVSGWMLTVEAEAEVIPGDPPTEPEKPQEDEQ